MHSIDRGHPLMLASASPRRRELLARVGVPLVVAPVAVDEAVAGGEAADAYLERVVADKARAAVAHRRDTEALHPTAAVLVADTSVIVADTILGKPEGRDEATEMVARLSGRVHVVATRFALWSPEAEREHTVYTRVWFRELTPEQIARYAATGEGDDKAGAYGIQGVGAMLVSRIEGSYTNVVGLPLGEVIEAMQREGLIGPCPPA